MGYEVHITRRRHWLDDRGPAIKLAEWHACVRTDAELEQEVDAEALARGDSTLYPGDPGTAIWTAYSKHGSQEGVALFCHYDGNVTVTNPDEEVLRKFWKLAQRLHAKVQGDDGEVYGPDGKALDESQGRRRSRGEARPWWKFW